MEYRLDNDKIWDAKRFILAGMELARCYRMDHFGDQVRLQRFASALRAFCPGVGIILPHEIINALKNGELFEEILMCSPLSDSQLESFLTMFEQATGMRLPYSGELSLDYRRRGVFGGLFRFRRRVFELERSFTGFIEGGDAAYALSEKLYVPALVPCDEVLDDLLVLLLGDSFAQTFTEQELAERYDYPSTTDGELLDWEIDNM